MRRADAVRLRERWLAGLPAFRPAPLLGGFHRMTLAGAFRRVPLGRLPVETRWVAVEPSARVRLNASWQPGRRRGPTLLAVHGLTGSSDSPSMRGVARSAFAAGFHAVRLDLRRDGGTDRLADGFCHAGLTDDVAATVDLLLAGGRGPVHLVGFSMGGNIVLRLAGLMGGAAAGRLASVAAVSPSVDLAACAERIDGDPGLRPYRAHFLRGLTGVARAWAEGCGEGPAGREPVPWKAPDLARLRTIRAFDDLVTAPAFGFAGAGDYYARASARPHLGAIAVPALVIQSRDDRIVPSGPLDEERDRGALRDQPWITMVMTARGGHCGFLGRGGGGAARGGLARAEWPRDVGGPAAEPRRDGTRRSWAESRLVDYACLVAAWTDGQPDPG